MSKTITIEDDIYKTLVSLKGPGVSFSSVLRRHIFVPAKSNGELLDWHERQPPPQINLEVLDVIEKGRGQHSNGRK